MSAPSGWTFALTRNAAMVFISHVGITREAGDKPWTLTKRNGITLRCGNAAFTTRCSARLLSKFPAGLTVVRFEESLHQCASGRTWHGSTSTSAQRF